MSNNTNIPSYNFTHISSYVNGTMSCEDMYAFEKAMLNDPFLEDAVDGYRAANITTAATDIATIKNLLLPEKEETKVVPFYQQHKTWLNAAATIIVVASVGAITYAVFNNTPTNKQVAIAVPPKEQTLLKAADTTQDKNNSFNVTTNKPANTTIHDYNQSIIVADKQVEVASANQEVVSSLAKDKAKADTSRKYYDQAQISARDLVNMKEVTVEQALQGRVAGVDLKQNGKKYFGPSNALSNNNGYLNSDNSKEAIRIRGNASFNKNNAPLYIINGVPYDTLPTYVNGSTIKNIEILKDTTATAIYGARATNGVIIVTTNKPVAEILAKQNASAKAKEIENLTKSIAANNAAKVSQGEFMAFAKAKDSIAASKSELEEVVVIGYGTAKRRDMIGSVAKPAIGPLDSLMPVGGWQYYNQYINQKIGFIGDTTSNNHLVLTDKNGHKLDDIDIEFSVDKEGTAYNVKVITDIDSNKAKTLANAVTEGPKWISRKKKNKAKIPLKTP